MTQKEFTERTGITPTPEQFDYIHAVYMNTSMDKDQFCEEFKKYGESEILRDVHVRAVNFELQCKQKQEVIENIADYLITKACDYDSSEFYFKAVSLIGQRNVVLRKWSWAPINVAPKLSLSRYIACYTLLTEPGFHRTAGTARHHNG